MVSFGWIIRSKNWLARVNLLEMKRFKINENFRESIFVLVNFSIYFFSSQFSKQGVNLLARVNLFIYWNCFQNFLFSLRKEFGVRNSTYFIQWHNIEALQHSKSRIPTSGIRLNKNHRKSLPQFVIHFWTVAERSNNIRNWRNQIAQFNLSWIDEKRFLLGRWPHMYEANGHCTGVVRNRNTGLPVMWQCSPRRFRRGFPNWIRRIQLISEKLVKLSNAFTMFAPLSEITIESFDSIFQNEATEINFRRIESPVWDPTICWKEETIFWRSHFCRHNLSLIRRMSASSMSICRIALK